MMLSEFIARRAEMKRRGVTCAPLDFLELEEGVYSGEPRPPIRPVMTWNDTHEPVAEDYYGLACDENIEMLLAEIETQTAQVKKLMDAIMLRWRIEPRRDGVTALSALLDEADIVLCEVCRGTGGGNNEPCSECSGNGYLS